MNLNINNATFLHSKILLTAGAVAAAVLLLIFIAILPMLSQIKATVAGISANREAIAAMQRELAGYQLSHDELAKIREDNILPQIFPTAENMVNLVAGLEGAVINSKGSHVLAIMDKREQQNALTASTGGGAKPAGPVVRGLSGIEEVPYEMNYVGNFRQSENLLLYFENLSFPNHIRSISIAAETRQTDEKVLRNTGIATVKIEALFFVQNL